MPRIEKYEDPNNFLSSPRQEERNLQYNETLGNSDRNSTPNKKESLRLTRSKDNCSTAYSTGKNIITFPSTSVISQEELNRMKKLAQVNNSSLCSSHQPLSSQGLEKDLKRERILKKKTQVIHLDCNSQKSSFRNSSCNPVILKSQETDEMIELNKKYEHLESVKQLYSLACQANTLMIRDHQLITKKERKLQEANYNATLDHEMNKICQQQWKLEQQKQQEEKEKKIQSRKILELQIQDRNRQKLRNEETKALEALKLLEQYQMYEKEQQQQQQQQNEQKKYIALQIDQTNQQMKQMKLLAQEREQYEEIVASMYLKKKANEEEFKSLEHERIKKQNEEKIAKLRKQQEKTQDKQAEMDERRAKKAWENKERLTRKLEKQQLENKTLLWNEIHSERQQQQLLKKKLQLQENNLQHFIEQQALQDQNEKFSKQLEYENQQKERQLNYQTLLKEQIAERKAEKQRLGEWNNSYEIKKKLQEQLAVEKIKDQLLQQLHKQGVKQEHLVGLQKFKHH